jgi:tRNA threonylcarbamoyladenosine biosynthesis protein TsaE
VPDLETHGIGVVTGSPAQTQQLGERLGRRIRPGDVLCLSGELGAGKTTLAAGLVRGWGAAEAANSPTFVLVNEYGRASGGRLFHVDAYRLRGAADAESIAWFDLLNDPEAAVVLEWPERLAEVLPDARLWIALAWVDENARWLEISARGAEYQHYLEGLGAP